MRGLMRRFTPRTLVGQLMLVLAAVLILAQIINLSLLVGMQRIQARSQAFQEAVNYTAELMNKVPAQLPQQYPYIIPTGRGGPQGSFFISQDNLAIELEEVKHLPRYNNQFQAELEARGLAPSQTFVTFLARSPADRVGIRRTDADVPPPRRPRPPHNGPPPEGRPFDRPPPPSFNLRRADTDVGAARGPLSRPILQEIRISAEIAPNIWFNALLPHAQTETLTWRIILATFLLLGLALLTVWAFARRISRPLTDIALAAEQLGRGQAPDILPERGTVDMRQAASAFNKMQTRLTRMLGTQRSMLRAIGHDLRTPLTSLRLRAENIPDETERAKVISTLNDMSVMTEEILNWAKDASGTEAFAKVDLTSLLASMSDDYQDQGHDVTMDDVPSTVVRLRRVALKRALQNLIDNALNYGGNAHLSATLKGEYVIIHIDDNGPGVPEAQLTEILKPFARLETSRNKDTGGTGLGLSIAESIVQSHGGVLTLSNRKPSGLRVTLSIPKDAA